MRGLAFFFMSPWQPQTEVSMTPWRWQTPTGRPVCVVRKGALFRNPNLNHIPNRPRPIHNSTPTSPPPCPLAALVVMATTWDASRRQQRFSGFAAFLSLPWITTQTPRPGNESIWRRVKYGCRFVCGDIRWQPSSPRCAALAALYLSAQEWLCLFNTRQR